MLSDKKGQIQFTVSATTPMTNTLIISAKDTSATPTKNKNVFNKEFKFIKPAKVKQVTLDIDHDTQKNHYWRLADNEEKVTVTLTATDEQGQLVPGAKVKWIAKDSTAGKKVAGTEVTDKWGQAWADFKSDNIPGFLNVSAEVQHIHHDAPGLTTKLDQVIEFQQYKVTLSIKDIIATTDQEKYITATLTGIVNDKSTKLKDRIITNKSISYSWSDSTPLRIEYPYGNRSNSKGQILLKLIADKEVHGHLEVTLEDKGGVNNIGEQTATVDFYNYRLNNLTPAISNNIEARNSNNPVKLTAAIAIIKEDQNKLRGQLAKRGIQWSIIEQPKYTNALIYPIDDSTLTDGTMRAMLIAEKSGTVKVRAAIMHGKTTLTEKTAHIHFKQTPATIEISSEHLNKSNQADKCDAVELKIKVKDADNVGIPYQGIEIITNSELLKTRKNGPQKLSVTTDVEGVFVSLQGTTADRATKEENRVVNVMAGPVEQTFKYKFIDQLTSKNECYDT